jgi:hypothetical protein
MILRHRAIALGIAVSAAFVAAGLPEWNEFDQASAAPARQKASAQEKTQARQELNDVISSLRAVDTAYASGNSAEAQARFDDARSKWNGISPIISAREAREQQLLFDSLGGQLKASATPAKVKSTVSGMVRELREDIARELR